MTHLYNFLHLMTEKLSTLFTLCGQVDKSLSKYAKDEICQYIPEFFNRHPSSEMASSRGYYEYSTVPSYHTYLSGIDPINILAGLAFFAFLLQTIQSLVRNQLQMNTMMTMTTTPAPMFRSDNEVRALALRVDHAVQTFGDRMGKEFQMRSNLNNGIQKSIPWSWLSVVHMFQELLRRYWRARKEPPCYTNLICQVVLHFRRLTNA